MAAVEEAVTALGPPPTGAAGDAPPTPVVRRPTVLWWLVAAVLAALFIIAPRHRPKGAAWTPTILRPTIAVAAVPSTARLPPQEPRSFPGVRDPAPPATAQTRPTALLSCNGGCHAVAAAMGPLGALTAGQIAAGVTLAITITLLLSASPEAAPAPRTPAEEGERPDLQRKLEAGWQFLRPHTIRGTIMGSFAVVAKSLLLNVPLIRLSLVPRALLGLVALLCGNGYIVGINQIYDVDIDKVNKPFLPVAAGRLTAAQAWVMVVLLGSVGGAIVASTFGPLITALYAFGLFLGTIYSVPPLRLKQYAVPAFLIIATCRGFLLNWGVFYAVRAALGLPFLWIPQAQFITLFMVVFAVVISLTKDLPDTAGDRQFGIQTLSTRLGVAAVSKLALGLLLLNYAGAFAWALLLPSAFCLPVMLVGHSVFVVYLLYHFRNLARDNYSTAALVTFYSKIWNLFYSEYALFVAA